ncbi:MAG: hypothetical protein GF334_08720 [Candidatus Altiarchaeales archaeon]|nr:hypothetical protein [Candidatus Altiarchaeales archaeon]
MRVTCFKCGCKPEKGRLRVQHRDPAAKRGRRFGKTRILCQECGLVRLDEECRQTRSKGLKVLLEKVAMALAYPEIFRRAHE